MPGLPPPRACGPAHSGTGAGWPWFERGEPTAEEGAEGADAVERFEDGTRASASSWYMLGGDMRPLNRKGPSG